MLEKMYIKLAEQLFFIKFLFIPLNLLQYNGSLMRTKVREKIFRILDTSPPIKEILSSSDAVELKRERIKQYLSELLVDTFVDDPSIPPLEWILTRNTINILRNFLSPRTERILDYSFLHYLNDLLHKENLKGIEKPSSAFFAELDSLLKGIMRKTAIYSEKLPAFVKYKGRKAARLRSGDLSRMAAKMQKSLDDYPSGLDDEICKKRNINKLRILKYFGGNESEWNDWKWHIRHIIRDAKTLAELIDLTDKEFQAVELATKHKVPFGITPYYLSLIDFESHRKNDYALRAQVIPSLHYVNKILEFKECSGISNDFMLERDTSPVDGITRRYPKIVILKPILTCPQICVYCQRNWEIEDVYSTNAVLSSDKLELALQWIEKTPEINEVLITGGDPFLLSDEKIEKLLARLSNIDHVVRIRIGTRMLVTLPQRITDSLIRIINRFNKPGVLEILIVTHFEHPYEISPQTLTGVQKIRQNGMDVYNQLVYTFYNSKRFEAAALRLHLRSIGVTPYYTFNTKGKEETDEYRVPIPRLLQEQHEEARLLPGTVRTDEIVFNVPKLGKNYLRASQHHDVISILPDGRRVYEFHPWEKKISLADTYIYVDVSIYDYLKRLQKTGEKISDYKTIWYYY